MELANDLLKRYFNFSIFNIFLFLLFGFGIYFIFQLPFINSIFYEHDIDKFPLNLFFILIWFLLFFLIKKAFEGSYKFALSFRRYDFHSSDWPDKWDNQGNNRIYETEENALYVTDSNSGCILKNYYWKNFEMNFKCKFPLGCDNIIVGIIFRAVKLSDYFMVQINNKGDQKKINPHVRINGVWEMIDGGPSLNINIERDIYYNFNLKVLNQRVELFIDNSKQLDWFLPTNSEIDLKDSTNDKGKDAFVPRIDFKEEYGRVGFRAYGNEGAIIKDLSIKRLPSFL